MATGKSSAKSGGKKRSACFFVNDGFPVNKFVKFVMDQLFKKLRLVGEVKMRE